MVRIDLSKIVAHASAVLSGVKHLYRRRMTLRYPESKLELPTGYQYPKAGYKGRHVLDMQKCTGCSICEVTCRNIAGAIKMVKVDESFPQNRKTLFPQIDYGLCVFCGFCVDGCVFGGLVMSSDYELSAYEKSALIYSPKLLATPPAKAGGAKLVVDKYQAYHKSS